jgi:serine/threonine-protein kinase
MGGIVAGPSVHQVPASPGPPPAAAAQPSKKRPPEPEPSPKKIPEPEPPPPPPAPPPTKRVTELGGGVKRITELPGTILAHYRVGPVLAKGQSGLVFRAEDLKHNRDVALKVLWPEFAKNDEDVQRFIRSMKTVLPLRHPNLVSLYGAGKKGPYCWVAMEYVEGESLTRVIQRIGVAGMLDWRHAFRIAIQIAQALDFAHQRQIVHRNITPQNVLVRAEDRVAKLGDLMLAKAMEGAMAEQLTKPGELLGDVRYMSPEQTRGPQDVDERSDIYSLGALTYALLTGQPPFESYSLVETINKIRQEKPEDPKKYQLSIPERFRQTVLSMLAKRPENRFQSAADLLKDLKGIAKYYKVSL